MTYEVPKKKKALNTWWLVVPVFVYPWFAGVLSAFAISMMKGVTNVVGTEKEFGNNFKYPLTYFLFLLAPLAAFSEVGV